MSMTHDGTGSPVSRGRSFVAYFFPSHPSEILCSSLASSKQQPAAAAAAAVAAMSSSWYESQSWNSSRWQQHLEEPPVDSGQNWCNGVTKLISTNTT